MANSFRAQVTEDGSRNSVVKVTATLDSSNLDQEVVIDITDQFIDPIGDAVGVYRIDYVKFDVQDGLILNLYWGGVPTLALTLSGNGKFRIGDKYGGTSLHPTGNINDGRILASTTGWTSGTKSLSFTLYLVKQVYPLAPVPPECFLLQENGDFLLQENDDLIGLETCEEPETITVETIKWWDGYLVSSEGNTPTGFTLRIWADSSGAPPDGYTTQPYLYTETFLLASCNQIDLGVITFAGGVTMHCFTHQVTLGTPFVATPGTKYWVSITCNITFPPSFAWISCAGAGTSYIDFLQTLSSNAWNLGMVLSNSGGALLTQLPDLTTGNANPGTTILNDPAVNPAPGYPAAVGYEDFTLT